MGNRNSSKSKVHGQVTRFASNEAAGYDSRIMGMPTTVAKFRDEYYTGKSNAPLDSDETFNSFIRRSKYKIKTVSHIDREQSNNVAPAAPPPDQYEVARDNQNDQFSNYIQSTKKKLRSTTSSMRKNGSFNFKTDY